MKTQILVTLEFEPGCQLMPGKTDWTHDALSVMTSPRALHLEVHEVLEAWQRTNPFWLQDPEALKVTSHLANSPEDNGHDASAKWFEPLARDMEKTAHDLLSIARLCRTL
ncbi:MAG: hypothetical protein KIS67_20210 [Verrucomicrobiae bacterium]|nr:hypothetical protein [Verrucomicrobiae bacterium]